MKGIQQILIPIGTASHWSLVDVINVLEDKASGFKGVMSICRLDSMGGEWVILASHCLSSPR